MLQLAGGRQVGGLGAGRAASWADGAGGEGAAVGGEGAEQQGDRP